MGSWKAFVGVGLVFVVGVLAGLIPGFYFTHRFPPPPPPPSMDPAHRDAMMIERLSKDLSLTEEQKTRVKPIVSRMNEKLDGQFRDMQPKVRQIFDEGFAEIEKQLNDDQKSRFRSLRERMGRGKGHRPPPPLFP